MELIVVVAVIAILLSVALLSIKPSETAKLRQQTAKVKGLVISVCDQAAFDQKVYFISPDRNGLNVEVLEKGSWQKSHKWPSLNWESELEVDWSSERVFNSAVGENSKEGWMCWPSGELTPGKVIFTLDKTQSTLEWNAVMQFEVQKDEN